MTEVKILSDRSNFTNSPFVAHRLDIVSTWLAIFILAFASLRGWVVLNLSLPSELVYSFSSLSVIWLAMYGFNCRSRVKDIYLTVLRNLLLINGLFGCFYVIEIILLSGEIEVSVLYFYLSPYIVFLFFRIPKNKINFILNVVFIGIAFSVIINFIISFNDVDGYDYLVDYNTKLRPGVFDAISRTGTYFRVGGYTGSYHDSANILGMITNFFFFRALTSVSKSSALYLGMALVAFIAMLFTQSATNILMAMVTITAFSIYLLIKVRVFHFIIFFFLAIFSGLILFFLIPETYIFIYRVSSDGDWAGMIKNISTNLLINPYFWFGHGYLDVSHEAVTEVAFIKLIMQVGIIPSCILYFVLMYPLYVYVVNKSCSFTLVPYLAAIVFGFLSLAHYGSLFRITSITIFYSMYALFFIDMIDEKYNLLK